MYACVLRVWLPAQSGSIAPRRAALGPGATSPSAGRRAASRAPPGWPALGPTCGCPPGTTASLRRTRPWRRSPGSGPLTACERPYQSYFNQIRLLSEFCENSSAIQILEEFLPFSKRFGLEDLFEKSDMEMETWELKITKSWNAAVKIYGEKLRVSRARCPSKLCWRRTSKKTYYSVVIYFDPKSNKTCKTNGIGKIVIEKYRTNNTK